MAWRPPLLRKVEQTIANKKPIVFHIWQPHWMFAKFDIKMLSDDNRLFQQEGIRKLARLGFKKDHKKAAKVLEKSPSLESNSTIYSSSFTILQKTKDRC